MKSEWKSERFYDKGRRLYWVYRLRDANKIDSSDNRECYGNYTDREQAEEYVKALNAGLKYCPFCGSEDVCPEGQGVAWWLQCDDCQCRTRLYDTMGEAIEAWNRRAYDMNDLKPCPFCGSKADISEIMMNKGPSRWMALCRDDEGMCEVRPSTGLMDTPEEAAEAWNRRVE